MLIFRLVPILLGKNYGVHSEQYPLKLLASFLVKRALNTYSTKRSGMQHGRVLRFPVSGCRMGMSV